MKATLVIAAVAVVGLMGYARHAAEPERTPLGIAVPELPTEVVARLPEAAAEGDQYLPQRTELAELVVGDRIPTAERRATAYAVELPGFAHVLAYDGFRPTGDGAWTYDRYASWMRFPLHR
jgi:hypothetical protein